MKTGKFITRRIRRLWILLHKEARKIIKDILGEQLDFEGHFDVVFDNLDKRRQEKLISWVRECKEGKCIAISSDRIKDLLGFVLKFRQTNFRAILTKETNRYFIVLFLDKHKYYEHERRKLGI